MEYTLVDLVEAWRRIVQVDVYIVYYISFLLDIGVGSLAAAARGEFRSWKFRRGVMGHLAVLLGVVLGGPVFYLLGLTHISRLIIMGFAINNFVSLYETYRGLGHELPEEVTKELSKWRYPRDDED